MPKTDQEMWSFRLSALFGQCRKEGESDKKRRDADSEKKDIKYQVWPVWRKRFGEKGQCYMFLDFEQKIFKINFFLIKKIFFLNQRVSKIMEKSKSDFGKILIIFCDFLIFKISSLERICNF